MLESILGSFLGISQAGAKCIQESTVECMSLAATSRGQSSIGREREGFCDSKVMIVIC
jgi:hypothetical protein